MQTLHLKYQNSTSTHQNGTWIPVDHESQRLALMHFSNGSSVVSFNRLDEVIYIAGLHGWSVIADGNPAQPI